MAGGSEPRPAGYDAALPFAQELPKLKPDERQEVERLSAMLEPFIPDTLASVNAFTGTHTFA